MSKHEWLIIMAAVVHDKSGQIFMLLFFASVRVFVSAVVAGCRSCGHCFACLLVTQFLD